MRRFAPYSRELQIIADRLLADPGSIKEFEVKIESALDGGPAASLRKSVSLGTQRSTGSFFTGEELLHALKSDTVAEPRRIYDPACGTGNLLLLGSKSLPILSTAEATLDYWGEHLFGSDLHPEFIDAAKARLVLSLFKREPTLPAAPHLRTSDLFQNLLVSDGLAPERYKDVSRILVNPPFQRIDAGRTCEWASGKVSAAAVFLETCIKHSPVGAKITAILPDVLRSGSNYEKWRSIISSNSSIDRIETFGDFDKFTGISVFILNVTKTNNRRKTPVKWWPLPAKSTVGDVFDVSVGAVVPFRNDETGQRFRYLHPKGLSSWNIVRSADETIRFNGSTVKTPFVVVRRNSRFEDKHRACATIIAGVGPVAVENHLIVLKPKDGKLGTCRRLLKVLQGACTNDWLNERIRCRHLTTAAVRDIPFLET